MREYQREFIQFAMDTQVLRFGSFELKSGRRSPYFFNAGLFNTGRALHKLGEFYASALVSSGLEYDVLFGPAYKVLFIFPFDVSIWGLVQLVCCLSQKGIPLVCATAIALDSQGVQSVPYAFNRKEPKDHGEGGQIVGSALAQGRVVVIDDVITAGTAIRESAGLLARHQAELAGVLIAIDRQEKGVDTELSAIQQVEQDLRVPVVSIVSLAHIIEFLTEQGGHEEALQAMLEYRQAWGISSSLE